MEWISNEAKARIALLWAEGASRSLMREEVGVSRHAVFGQIRRLGRRPPPEPKRSLLRFSLVEREEVSRGLAADTAVRTHEQIHSANWFWPLQ